VGRFLNKTLLITPTNDASKTSNKGLEQKPQDTEKLLTNRHSDSITKAAAHKQTWRNRGINIKGHHRTDQIQKRRKKLSERPTRGSSIKVGRSLKLIRQQGTNREHQWVRAESCRAHQR
jgi:hypothetical protein